jgi:hypothetical protein
MAVWLGRKIKENHLETVQKEHTHPLPVPFFLERKILKLRYGKR